MKTIKIIALAAIAAFVVFSCAPEPKLSDVDWKKVNSKSDPGKNTLNESVLGEFGSSIRPYTFVSNAAGDITAVIFEITATFPASSDFLKAGKSNVESKLRQFLSFHHFTKAEDPVTKIRIAGRADTLGSALTYEYVRQNVNTVTLRLTIADSVSDISNVILKIDGTKYTFAGGNKLDRVGIGKGGTAVYDDVYRELVLDSFSDISGFVEPGNKGWSLVLNTIDPSYADDVTGVLTDYTVASVNLSSFGGTTEAISAIYREVADQLKSGLKIQEFVKGSWSNVSGTTFTVDTDFPNVINVSPLTLKDLVPVRVTWEGSAPVTTTKEYFGVKQYVKILGENTSDVPDRWSPSFYKTGKVYGSVSDVWTTKGRDFISVDPFVSVYKKDFRGRNVVLDVVLNGGGGIDSGTPPTTYWLKDFKDDKKTFRDNFKIAYYSNGPGSVSQFYSRPDVVYVSIKDFEYFSYNPEGEENVGLNAVRITLDPDFEANDETPIYFYIGPEIRYNDNKTVFGDPANFMNGFFKVYEAGGLTRVRALTADRWANGTLNSADSEIWYTFPVTYYTQYRIWWNDSGDGDGTKTGDVAVYARYAESGDRIFGYDYSGTNVDDGWTTPQSFTFYNYQDDTVEVRVIPYNHSGSSTGTFGIVYSTGSTRPLTTWPPSATALTVNEWGDGNIPTSGGEQWFRFTATADTQYIHFSSGTLEYLRVQLYDSNGSRVGSEQNLTNGNAISPTVTSGRIYYIRAWPTYSSQNGTYQIGFTTSWDPPPWKAPSSTLLTVNVWANGEITSGGEQWFRFDATADPQHIHAVFGSLTRFYVQVYDSDGDQVESETSLSNGNTRSTSRGVTPNLTYYIRVLPLYDESGTYQIAFNESGTPPAWTPSVTPTTITEGVWANGNIASGGEQWFKFVATADNDYQYIHAYFGTLTNLYVQVYDSTGGTVGNSSNLSGSGGTSSYTTRTVTLDETYYIRVWPSYSYYDGTYKITFNTSYDPPWAEPLVFTPLTVNKWGDGNIPSSYGIQWFKFTATADPQYVHVIFGSLTELSMSVYDSNGDQVEYEAYLSNSNRFTSWSVTSGQVYYIRVQPSSYYGGRYWIAFSASDTAPAWTAPSSTLLTANVWADGNIASGGEQWFRFVATTSDGQYIHVNFGSLYDLYVEVYDSDGNTVVSRTEMDYYDTYVSPTVTSGDTYYIRVWPYYTNGSGTYQITFNESYNPPFSFPASTLPLTAGQWANGYISYYSDGVWYSFTVTQGQTYYFWWEDADNTEYDYCDVGVAAYYSNGTEIFDTDTGSGNSTNTETFEADRTGTVYVAVYPLSSGNYGDFRIAFTTTGSRP